MNTFFNSQFSPLIWTCHSHTVTKKDFHERCLRVEQWSFSELLEKAGFVFIYVKRVHFLAIDMFRISRNLSGFILNNIFKQKDNSRNNLRQSSEVSTLLVKTAYQQSDSVSSLGPKVWYLQTDDCTNLGDLNTFKKRNKKWKLESFPCKFCKIYISNIFLLEKEYLASK